MQIICFEDDLVDQLRPITLARPAYAISCASIRLIELLQRMPGNVFVSVREHLRELEKSDRGVEAVGEIDDSDGVLLVNARLVPRVSIEAKLKTLAASTQSAAVLDRESGAVLAARLTAKDLANRRAELAESKDVAKTLASIAGSQVASDIKLDCFVWPHDVVQCHMNEMRDAMEWRVASGEYQQTTDGVFCGEGVEIGEYASIDTSSGPIVLDDDVRVGPFSFLSGPVYAGKSARVIEHAALKDGVALGHTVKIGGEVEASVIESYTNKQHHGFLGHSYLGSWINLGAGTCNSDLKNTYGKINIQYGERKLATGMQFLGCIMGDYSKTAINTSIFTGKVIGVCSMLYGFATSNVPSFVNYATLFGQSSLLPAEVMISTQARMFARRNVAQRECDKQLIHQMYRLTEPEREASDQYLM
tara:strand:- start:300377 stop:301630 length:1254 start_codon:yes stop_codon:yes gene_type:complete